MIPTFIEYLHMEFEKDFRGKIIRFDLHDQSQLNAH